MKKILALNDINFADAFIEASTDGTGSKLDRRGLEAALSTIYNMFGNQHLNKQDANLKTT